MSAGAEADHLMRIVQIRLSLEILPFQPGNINQFVVRGRLSRQFMDGHLLLAYGDYRPAPPVPPLFSPTGGKYVPFNSRFHQLPVFRHSPKPVK